jgi:hypothetical protein
MKLTPGRSKRLALHILRVVPRELNFSCDAKCSLAVLMKALQGIPFRKPLFLRETAESTENTSFTRWCAPRMVRGHTYRLTPK